MVVIVPFISVEFSAVWPERLGAYKGRKLESNCDRYRARIEEFDNVSILVDLPIKL